jgi:hypothetical protein
MEVSPATFLLSSLLSYVQATHATFEDFMECVCRLADTKCLPEANVDVVEWSRVTSEHDRGMRHTSTAVLLLAPVG